MSLHGSSPLHMCVFCERKTETTWSSKIVACVGKLGVCVCVCVCVCVYVCVEGVLCVRVWCAGVCELV